MFFPYLTLYVSLEKVYEVPGGSLITQDERFMRDTDLTKVLDGGPKGQRTILTSTKFNFNGNVTKIIVNALGESSTDFKIDVKVLSGKNTYFQTIVFLQVVYPVCKEGLVYCWKSDGCEQVCSSNFESGEKEHECGQDQAFYSFDEMCEKDYKDPSSSTSKFLSNLNRQNYKFFA